MELTQRGVNRAPYIGAVVVSFAPDDPEPLTLFACTACVLDVIMKAARHSNYMETREKGGAYNPDLN